MRIVLVVASQKGIRMLDTHPPIVEMVLGVQFSPLVKLTSAHYGLFWTSLGNEWKQPSDNIPIEEQFEVFGEASKRPTASAVGIRVASNILNRLMLKHASGDRLLQLQPTRFHYNWRKSTDFYPRYATLIEEFMQKYERFTKFIADNEIGPIIPNQWEITYINSFPKGEHWGAPADWPEVLPGLFGDLYSNDSLELEQRAAKWAYVIKPNRGRLHVSANLGRVGDDLSPTLLLTLTARGPVEKNDDNVRMGLDIGHKAAVEVFLGVTPKPLQERWAT